MMDGILEIDGMNQNDSSNTNLSGHTVRRARILDPDFVYVPAAATDVQKTWMRLTDWKPKQQ
jgi:hypothetical protein